MQGGQHALSRCIHCKTLFGNDTTIDCRDCWAMKETGICRNCFRFRHTSDLQCIKCRNCSLGHRPETTIAALEKRVQVLEEEIIRQREIDGQTIGVQRTACQACTWELPLKKTIAALENRVQDLETKEAEGVRQRKQDWNLATVQQLLE